MAAIVATVFLSNNSVIIPRYQPVPTPASSYKLLSRGRRARLFPVCRSSVDLGDFGARDPFPEEIASNFGDKVLGFKDTEHKILIPNVAALSLAELQVAPASTFPGPMSRDDANQLLRKVIGWRLVDEGAGLRLQCLWKLKDYESGVELINRIRRVLESLDHQPNLHLEQPNQVRAELWTEAVGGLTMNDFIVAAKIDGIKTTDLLPRKRAWA